MAVDHNEKIYCTPCVLECNKMVEGRKLKNVWTEYMCCTFCGSTTGFMNWDEVHKYHVKLNEQAADLAKQLIKKM